MRILVTSTPGAGHIHPVIPLALALRARGHDLVWATGPSSCRGIEAFGIETRPAGPDAGPRNVRFAALAGHLSQLAPRDRRREAMPIMFGNLSAPVMRDALRPLFDELRPDLVIHEVAELAAAPLASSRGIPHVTVAFSDVVAPDVTERVADSVAPLWMDEGLAPPSDAGWFDHVYLHPFPQSMSTPHEQLTPMRPVAVPAATADRPSWLDSFGRDRPGIYVTFGTEVGLQAPWQPLLTALAAIDADVVATIGNPAVADVLGVTPRNVRVETWVPQSLLLERAVLVVSHAGAGTLIAAAAAGVPQLCVPIAADQWDNADALARANAGEVAEMNERTADDLALMVRELLAGACDEGARSVAAEIAAMPTPGEIVPTLEALVE
jgi:UDP:flavonoid glycosyltransferase YjiC (YdhE family)